MLRQRLVDALGVDAVKTAPEDLAVYSFDAYTDGGTPSAVVLPASMRDVSAVVKIARDCGEPIVARGAGTGLCGGAVPMAGGIIISFARMNRVLELDAPNRRVRVQPGLINLDLSRRVASSGLFYAPDPSSQQISTIGGNIATNAGGPHCLSYGTTVNHVLALEVVDDRGEVFTTSIDESGYDLTAAIVGSEGTLGIVTGAWLKLLALPEAVRVSVAAFGDVDSASEAVSAIIAAGIVPTALEMMDTVITQAVEAAFHAGYPTDAGAVLLVEQAGLEEDVAASEAAIHAIAQQH
jgi:glycolate oxidase